MAPSCGSTDVLSHTEVCSDISIIFFFQIKIIFIILAFHITAKKIVLQCQITWFLRPIDIIDSGDCRPENSCLNNMTFSNWGVAPCSWKERSFSSIFIYSRWSCMEVNLFFITPFECRNAMQCTIYILFILIKTKTQFETWFILYLLH